MYAMHNSTHPRRPPTCVELCRSRAGPTHLLDARRSEHDRTTLDAYEIDTFVIGSNMRCDETSGPGMLGLSR
jgi:hypothetical protein